MRNKKAKGLKRLAKSMYQLNPEKGTVKTHYKRLKTIYKLSKGEI